jgi:hypothetical protein
MLQSDIIIVSLAATVLAIAYLADPNRMMQRFIADTDTMSARTAAILLLIVQGINVVLLAAIAYTCKGVVYQKAQMLIKRLR